LVGAQGVSTDDQPAGASEWLPGGDGERRPAVAPLPPAPAAFEGLPAATGGADLTLPDAAPGDGEDRAAEVNPEARVAALIAAQLDAQAEVAAAEQALKDAQLIAEAAALAAGQAGAGEAAAEHQARADAAVAERQACVDRNRARLAFLQAELDAALREAEAARGDKPVDPKGPETAAAREAAAREAAADPAPRAGAARADLRAAAELARDSGTAQAHFAAQREGLITAAAEERAARLDAERAEGDRRDAERAAGASQLAAAVARPGERSLRRGEAAAKGGDRVDGAGPTDPADPKPVKKDDPTSPVSPDDLQKLKDKHEAELKKLKEDGDRKALGWGLGLGLGLTFMFAVLTALLVKMKYIAFHFAKTTAAAAATVVEF